MQHTYCHIITEELVLPRYLPIHVSLYSAFSVFSDSNKNSRIDPQCGIFGLSIFNFRAPLGLCCQPFAAVIICVISCIISCVPFFTVRLTTEN